VTLPGFRSLVDAASPAVLTVYRADGQPVVSPVWIKSNGNLVELVIAESDPKLAYLRANPMCILLVFETIPPFRGLRISGKADLSPDVGAAVRKAIATKYLGPDKGTQYADLSVRPAGYVVRLSLSEARTWDLSESLPPD